LLTILLVCPLVALLFGLKYGLFSGGTHGSPAPPQGYPFMYPRDANLCTKSKKVLPGATSSKICVPAGSTNPAALLTIFEICPLVAFLFGLK
jgi:hypothetical protein